MINHLLFNLLPAISLIGHIDGGFWIIESHSLRQSLSPCLWLSNNSTPTVAAPIVIYFEMHSLPA
jgi:hypothetical protein